jgi:AraC-like DNA-binding protein
MLWVGSPVGAGSIAAEVVDDELFRIGTRRLAGLAVVWELVDAEHELHGIGRGLLDALDEPVVDEEGDMLWGPLGRVDMPIGRIASEVGWSHKHLIAKFRQQVGLTPKTAARLVRLEGVWRRLEQRRPLDWGQLARDAGYADQAHLIRDFHEFTGITPTKFLGRLPTRASG